MATVAAQAAEEWPFCCLLRAGTLAADDYKSARRTAFAIVLGQLGITLLAGGLFLLSSGARAGYSALIGGGIGTLASLYMAVSFFRAGSAADPRHVLRGVYVGELVKLMMTAALFVAVIVFLPVVFLPLFSGYLATFFVYWLALLKALPRT